MGLWHTRLVIVYISITVVQMFNNEQIGETGKGVAAIAPMLTITRVYNSIFAVSAMRRYSTFAAL